MNDWPTVTCHEHDTPHTYAIITIGEMRLDTCCRRRVNHALAVHAMRTPPSPGVCPACSGYGRNTAAAIHTCPVCRGSGCAP
jgi:hypothetical protein